MVGWHHWLNGYEFEQTPGYGEGQGGLRAALHGDAKSQTTKQQNNNCLEGWQEKLWGRKGALEINMDVVTNFYLLQEPRFCNSHLFSYVCLSGR